MVRKKQYDYYDDNFKATAVALGALSGVQAQAVAGVLNIHPVMLYRWKQEVCEGKIAKTIGLPSPHSSLRRRFC